MAAAVLFLGTTAVCAAPRVEVPFTTAHVAINGVLSEWDNAATTALVSPFGRKERDNEVTVRLMWDTGKLYVAFVVKDTELDAVRVSDDAALWHDDAVEVFIDSRHDGAKGARLDKKEFVARGGRILEDGQRIFRAPDDFQFIVNIRNSVLTSRGLGLDAEDMSWDADIYCAARCMGTVNNGADTDTGYTVEIAIPWKSMDITPRRGLVMGTDFVITDIDSDGRFPFDWSGIRPCSQPHRWGDMILTGGPKRALRSLPEILALLAVAAFLGLAVLIALRWTRRPRSAGKLSTADPRYRDVVDALRMHMEAHYSSPDFSTAEAAGALHMSERKLQMVLKNAGIRPFREILNDFRLTKAAELLTASARSVAEIGSEVGFSRPDVFSRQFRAKFGMSASDYRKSAPFRRPPS